MIILAERRELYEQLLPRHGVGAELGVYDAENAEMLLHYTQSKKLYLCDNWAWTTPHMRPAHDCYHAACRRAKKSPQFEIVKQSDLDWLPTLRDKSLDWVYLDTTHEYEQTRQELQLLRSKVRQIIAGHDLCCMSWHNNVADGWGGGVMLALMEELGKGWLELIAITNPALAKSGFQDMFSSWVCRVKE